MLVMEDRLPLLLLTYAPNLWRVFLMYAQDVVGKTTSITSTIFPEEAQANEKGDFLMAVFYSVTAAAADSVVDMLLIFM